MNTLELAIKELKERDKEIERLKIELQDTKEHLGEYLHEQEEENKRLNNIINELDNWLGKKILSWEDDGNVSDNIYHERLAIQMIYFKLQELKGSDK